MKKKQTADIEEEDVSSYSARQLQFKKELPEISVLPQCKLKDQSKNDIMNFKGVYTPDKDTLWYGENSSFQ